MREDAHEKEKHWGEAREGHRDITGGGAIEPGECDEEEKELEKKNLYTRTPGVVLGSRVRQGYSLDGCGLMPELWLKESDWEPRETHDKKHDI